MRVHIYTQTSWYNSTDAKRLCITASMPKRDRIDLFFFFPVLLNVCHALSYLKLIFCEETMHLSHRYSWFTHTFFQCYLRFINCSFPSYICDNQKYYRVRIFIFKNDFKDSLHLALKLVSLIHFIIHFNNLLRVYGEKIFTFISF